MLKTDDALKEILRAKIKYEFNDMLEYKIEEIISKLKGARFCSTDTITIEFPFTFEGFGFIKDCQ